MRRFHAPKPDVAAAILKNEHKKGQTGLVINMAAETPHSLLVTSSRPSAKGSPFKKHKTGGDSSSIVQIGATGDVVELKSPKSLSVLSEPTSVDPLFEGLIHDEVFNRMKEMGWEDSLAYAGRTTFESLQSIVVSRANGLEYATQIANIHKAYNEMKALADHREAQTKESAVVAERLKRELEASEAARAKEATENLKLLKEKDVEMDSLEVECQEELAAYVIRIRGELMTEYKEEKHGSWDVEHAIQEYQALLADEATKKELEKATSIAEEARDEHTILNAGK